MQKRKTKWKIQLKFCYKGSFIIDEILSHKNDSMHLSPLVIYKF